MFLGLRRSTDPAIIDANSARATSFRELVDAGASLAEALGRGRSLVFLLAANDPFSLMTYAGAVEAGHAVVLLDASSSPELTADLIRRYRPTWMAGRSGTAELLKASGIPFERSVEMHAGELARTGYPETPELHPDLAVLLTTSGTTGSSKLVRLSKANIHANATSIAEYLELSGVERPITSLPLFYSFGLSVVNSHWLVGAPVVLTAESVVQASFWTAFRERRCTSLAGVPFTYQMLERVGFREMDLPSLRHLQQAGGRLEPVLIRMYGQHMADRGARFFVMYGQTEATARISYVPPDWLPDKVGSAGIAIPGGRLEIDSNGEGDDSGRSIGEVVYRGENVMLGYAEGPGDLALGDELHGVLRTGDLGYIDDDGFLFLTGRSKRIAKLFGLRINLDEVEARLRQRGPAAVVGATDVVWGFCAFGDDDEVARLARTMAKELRLHPSTLRLRAIPALPTTTSGKIDYRALERLVDEASVRAGPEGPTVPP